MATQCLGHDRSELGIVLGGQRLRNATENLLAREVRYFPEHQCQQQQSGLVNIHVPTDRAELFWVEGFRRTHPVRKQSLEHTNDGLQPRQAEIAHFERPDLFLDHPALDSLFIDEYIAGMQILVHVTGCMNVVKCLQDIAGNVGNPAVRIQAQAGNQVRQWKIAALDDEIEGVLELERVVDKGDVRMAHDQELAQFVLPDAAHFAVRLLVRDQDLGYERVSPVVDAIVHHAESALPVCVADEVAAICIDEYFAFGRRLEMPRLAESNVSDRVKTGRFHRRAASG